MKFNNNSNCIVFIWKQLRNMRKVSSAKKRFEKTQQYYFQKYEDFNNSLICNTKPNHFSHTENNLFLLCRPAWRRGVSLSSCHCCNINNGPVNRGPSEGGHRSCNQWQWQGNEPVTPARLTVTGSCCSIQLYRAIQILLNILLLQRGVYTPFAT